MQYTPFALPLAASIVLLVGLALYAQRFRNVSAEYPFAILLWLCAIFAFFQLLAITTTDLTARILFSELVVVPATLVAPVVLWMALEYTGNRKWLPRRRGFLLLLVPLFVITLSMASTEHTLFRYDFQLDMSAPLPFIKTEKGIGYWLFYAYMVSVLVIACIVLAAALQRKTLRFRNTLLLLVGILIPLSADLVMVAIHSPLNDYSLAPSLFVLGGLLYAWALFWNKLFELKPFARQNVMDHLNALVFVVDSEQCLVDLNAPAQAFAKFPKDVLSKKTNALPEPWAQLFALPARELAPQPVEISADGKTRIFDKSVIPLQDKRGRTQAHAYLLLDVTERKRIEKELSDTKALLEAAFVQTPIPMVLVRAPDGIVQIVNPALLEYLGVHSKSEMVGVPLNQLERTWLDYDAQGNPVPFDRIPLALALQGITTQNVEMSVRLADNTVRWELASAAPVYNAQGEQIAAQLAFPEITAYKQVEQALCASEERYRQLADNSPIAIALVDLESGKIVYANARALELFALTREQAIGSSARDRYADPLDREKFLEVLRAQHQVTDMQARFKKGSGEIFWASISSNISLYENRPVIHTSYYDITERRNAEEALHVNLAKYSVLFEAFPLGITITDARGKILETNHAAEKILDLPKQKQNERLYDGPEWYIVRPDGTPMPAEEYASVRALREQRQVENVEMGVVTGADQIKWINVTAAPIPLEGYGVAITYGDITERKLAEAALQQANTQLRAQLQEIQLL